MKKIDVMRQPFLCVVEKAGRMQKSRLGCVEGAQDDRAWDPLNLILERKQRRNEID